MRLTVTGCAGKRIPTTFTEMAKRVRGGTTVYVTTADGRKNDASCTEPYASPDCVKVSRGRGFRLAP
jgi:hypothetical protein